MKKKDIIHVKQKIRLYFDENFPMGTVNYLKSDKNWKKKCKIISAHDEGNLGKKDGFHFNYCKKKDFVLVTLDSDFMDDTKFPIMKIPGIIRIASNKQDQDDILNNLAILISFLSNIPFPRFFMGDTKFQVSKEGCIIRGRDSSTREIKSLPISKGTSAREVMKEFSYL